MCRDSSAVGSSGRALSLAALLLFGLPLPASAGVDGAAAGRFSVGEMGLLPAGASSEGPPSVQVISRRSDGITLEFDLPALTRQSVSLDGTTYDLFEIEGGAAFGEIGSPMLPGYSRLIQIPDRSGVSIEVTAVETREYDNVRPFPMQSDESDRFVVDARAYSEAGFGTTPRVAIGEPAIARDLRVIPVTFRPVRFDPARNTLEVASRIEVQVRFAGVDLRNALAVHHETIPPSFDALYRDLVANYEGPRDGQTVSLGSYVIICPNNADVINALAPLVEWRTRKGFQVRVATTAETGTTSTQIQTWLRNAYSTWENPPEFITLVGDANGTVAIPCWSYSGGDTDHPYCQLDGADILADAHIGRISVEDVNRLRLAVTKIVGYESTPYMTDPAWYSRACLTGDPRYSGITCVQIMQWIKTRLRQVGYTQIDTIYSEPFVSQMTTSLNRGTTMFAYRGYLGMSGWGTGNTSALTNGWKMMYAVNITCGTGNFASGTAISESWLRAGSPPSTPTGGIASIGTATSATHTRYNNCMMYGVFHALLYEGKYTFGESLTRGKYELYVNYGAYDAGGCNNFTHWNNLMGEAAGECWTGLPQAMTVTHPATIPQGSNTLQLSVTAGGGPCADAYVCLWKDPETWICGTTNSLGEVELPISVPTTGSLKITVTKHDHQPYLATVTVAPANVFVGYAAMTIDDDMAGESAGNGDGALNPTETIELPVQVRNFGTQTAYGVTATLSSEDPYVTITDGDETFGDIAPGGSAWTADDFGFTLAGAAPEAHVARFALDVVSGAHQDHSLIEIPVSSAAFVFEDLTLYGTGSEITPGESAELSVQIGNIGSMGATAISARLASMSSWVAVTDPFGSYGAIGVGGSGENTSDHFAVRAADDCYRGHLAALSIQLEFSNGARDTVPLVLQIGTRQTTDPTGPDRYGYYAFDDTDAGYEFRPTYHWIEIDPNHGGSGTDVGLVDYGGDNDDSRVVDLPFPFTYYGQTFTRATICSNGWMAMGSTYLRNQRNWNIPGAGAPQYMIAGMWDDLYQTGTNRVYQRYDASQHRYVVQWSRVSAATGGTENFEIILYDPVHHPTPTGDGMIDFQFDTFNNTDTQQQYSTTGIENGDQTDGVMYGYYNRYNAGAATIQSGRAIRFVALPTAPCGSLSGTVRNATNGNTPLPGAAVSVVELDRLYTTGDDGTYADNLPAGTYTLIAGHSGFTSDTLNVEIRAGESTMGDFALEDIQAPIIDQTTQLPNTSDMSGPYDVQTRARDDSDFSELALVYDVNDSGWTPTALNPLGQDLYHAGIPGQPFGSLVCYYIRAVDAGGRVTLDPPSAPDETYCFWVVAPMFSDDVETGGGSWTHYAASSGYGDQWHIERGMNHTTGGAFSWKFGSVGLGTYAPMGDGALETRPVVFDGIDASLTFWHMISAETASYMEAHDGGLVEMSVDGGPWTQLLPLGGYGYRIVNRAQDPGPFPDGTAVYSGTYFWRQASFRLLDLVGQVRFRFRFGSDGEGGGTGWLIDDIEILPDEPNLSGTDAFEEIPQTLMLHPSMPSPLAPATGARIAFDLPQTLPVRLGVFDVGGRLVRVLVHETLPAGAYSVVWDGRDEADRALASGVYFYILDAGRRELVQRTLLIR